MATFNYVWQKPQNDFLISDNSLGILTFFAKTSVFTKKHVILRHYKVQA
jgi:hypothetical protein